MSDAPSQPVVHLELHTANLARALGFYAQACGWNPRRVSDPHGSYLSLDLGRSELAGGIVEGHSGRPLWLPYVEVDGVAGATDRARELGASVLLEPREGPAGWRSVVSAPEAGEIAFWQPKR
jgi:predicted enzyme related to lactoylglutathione lyase